MLLLLLLIPRQQFLIIIITHDFEYQQYKFLVRRLAYALAHRAFKQISKVPDFFVNVPETANFSAIQCKAYLARQRHKSLGRSGDMGPQKKFWKETLRNTVNSAPMTRETARYATEYHLNVHQDSSIKSKDGT